MDIPTSQVWKRHCCGLAYRWGTLDRESGLSDRVRRNHRGDLRRNPINNRLEPYYPSWKTRAKVYNRYIVLDICEKLTF